MYYVKFLNTNKDKCKIKFTVLQLIYLSYELSFYIRNETYDEFSPQFVLKTHQEVSDLLCS